MKISDNGSGSSTVIEVTSTKLAIFLNCVLKRISLCIKLWGLFKFKNKPTIMSRFADSQDLREQFFSHFMSFNVENTS